jgi:hypothetical protein
MNIIKQMKIKLILLISLLSVISVYGQKSFIPKDTIASWYLKGDIIIINHWALKGPACFFDSAAIFQDTYTVTALSKDSALAKYGFFGEKFRIYELTVPPFDSISYGYFVDARILSYLNPQKEIFYFILGMSYLFTLFL